jgi:hypothetical protein
VSFGRAYLKSRSSDSFTAAIKDFIAPIPINLSNCSPKDLLNTAFARASNFAPVGGQLNDWISDDGKITVSDASNTSGFLFSSPARLVAQFQATTGGVAIDTVVGDEALVTGRRGLLSEARQYRGTPWPSHVESEPGAAGGARVQVPASVPYSRLVA